MEPRFSDEQNFIQIDFRSVGNRNIAGTHTLRRGIAINIDPAVFQDPVEPFAYMPGKGRHNLIRLADQGKTQLVCRASPLVEKLSQPVLHGQQHFDACGTGSDNTDAMFSGLFHDTFDKAVPATDKIIYGFDRRCILFRSGNRFDVRG